MLHFLSKVEWEWSSCRGRGRGGNPGEKGDTVGESVDGEVGGEVDGEVKGVGAGERRGGGSGATRPGAVIQAQRAHRIGANMKETKDSEFIPIL